MDDEPVWDYNAPQCDFGDDDVFKDVDGSSHGTEEQGALNIGFCWSAHNSDDVTMNYCVDMQSEEPKTTQGDCVNLSARKVSKSTQHGSRSQAPSRSETGGKATAATRRSLRSQGRVGRPSSTSVIGKKAYAGKMTKPLTPSFMRRRKLKFLHLYAKSTEDRQLDQIRALRQALVKKRKLSAASCAVALSSFRCGMVLSTRRATRPQEFNFALEKRLRGTKSESGAASTWKKLDFVGDLRKPIDHKKVASSGITVPVPLKFHPSRKRSSAAEVEKFETMAEKVTKFTSKTARNKFKALPLNQKMIQNPKLGVETVAPKVSKEPEPSDLELDRRVQQHKRPRSNSSNDQHHEFHGQPVPKKKMRLSPVVEKAQKITRARSLVNPRGVGIPFQPKLVRRATVVVPFSFEQRTKEMLDKKEQKIKSFLEQEKKGREFHARPLKDLQPVLPEKKARRATVPEPFNLEIEARCAARFEAWKQKVQEDENKRKMAALFKANPLFVLDEEPFVPAKSSKAPTEVIDVQLNTEKRAEKRQEWLAWKNDKQILLEAVRKREEKAKLEEAQKEVQRMRKEAVQKANPIRHYKEVHIVPSDRPLTNPESPHFSERLKGKALRH